VNAKTAVAAAAAVWPIRGTPYRTSSDNSLINARNRQLIFVGGPKSARMFRYSSSISGCGRLGVSGWREGECHRPRHRDTLTGRRHAINLSQFRNRTQWRSQDLEVGGTEGLGDGGLITHVASSWAYVKLILCGANSTWPGIIYASHHCAWVECKAERGAIDISRLRPIPCAIQRSVRTEPWLRFSLGAFRYVMYFRVSRWRHACR